MKNSKLVRTFSLTIILVFAVMSIASAGAIMKRGKGGNSDRSRDEGKSKVEQKDQRDNRDQRSKTDRKNDDSHSYRPSDDSRASDPAKRDRRTPDATPSKSREKSFDRGDDGRNRDNDSNNKNRTNDSKFRRNNDRPEDFSRDRFHHNRPINRKPPVLRGGYFHYSSGYPYYFDYGLRYGHWEFDYVSNRSCRSVYFYYGYFPYIPSERVVIIRRPTVTYVETPLIVKERYNYPSSGYYLDNQHYTVDAVLADIKSAWERNDPELILRHTKDDMRIDIILDAGEMYSVNAADYREMTADAVNHTETISFRFDSLRSRGDDKVVAYGTHTFYSLDGGVKSVYISYELLRRNGEWVIDQVGSSLDPLDH